jgi:acetyl esterase/lipase
MNLLIAASSRTTVVVLSFTVAITALAVAANATAQDRGYSRTSDVIYGRTAGLALTMEVLTPTQTNGRGVIWVVSSGGYSSRDQTLVPSFAARIAPLLRRGYTVFAAIHGSSPVFNLQDYAQDARRAVRFVREHAGQFGIDPARLGIAGSSSGGIIALLIAMTGDAGAPASEDPVERASSRVQAAGVFFPATDLANFGERGRRIVDVMRQGGVVDPGFQFYDSDPTTGARRPVADDAGVLRHLRELSPVTHVTPDDPPTILIHGSADRAAPIEQSRSFIGRLGAAKVPARLVVRDGKGHAWPGWEADSALVADWFDVHLTN